MTTQAENDARVSAAQGAIDALAAFVAATVPPQTITAFTASPTSVAPGATVTISWATENAIAALLDGVPVGPAGSVTRAPDANTSYTLVVKGSAPDVSRSIFVAVQASPPPATGLASLAAGSARALGSWVGPGRGAHERTDYSGIALDAAHNRILFFGGGHGIGQLTDIRAFDLATLQWSSLYPQIAWEDMIAANVLPIGAWSVRGSDPVPSGRHTYNASIVHDGRYYLFVELGGVQDINGPLPTIAYDPYFCWYDLATGKWSWSKMKTPWFYGCGVAAAGDKVLIVATDRQSSNWGNAWVYDPATDTALRLPKVASGQLFHGTPSLVYFPPTQKHYALFNDGAVHEISYDAANPLASTSVKLTTTGAFAKDYIAYAYDPVNNVIGGSIHAGVYTTFDPATKAWKQTAITVEAGSAGMPDTLFHCSTFDPASGCFIALGKGGITWAYRPEPGGGASVAPPPAPVPVTPERVQMTDAPVKPGDQDGPNWTYANLILRAPWKNAGGDWRDASNVAQGTNHYALSPIIAGAGDVTLEVKALVTRLLTENTGIYLRTVSGNVNVAQPRLHIDTDRGPFDPPCIVDTWLDRSSGVLGASTKLGFPCIIKFELSAVAGTVQSATLTLNVSGVAGQAVFAADFLDPPSLALSGPVAQGIAASVTNDRDLVSHRKVLEYNNLVSVQYIRDNFRAYATSANPGHGRPTIEQDLEIIDWPQYGLKAARVWAITTNQRLISWHHWAEPKQTGPLARPYQRDYGDGYTHLFFRFLMCIGEDLQLGMTEQGMKLPGMAGMYEWSTSGAITLPPPSSFAVWEARLWHTPLSAAHPGRHRLGTYFYGVEAPVGKYGGSGNPAGPLFTSGYLKAGTVHCIEQEIKLNTMAANSTAAVDAVRLPGAGAAAVAAAVAEVTANANPDGEMRVWLDGVKVFERTDMRIRGIDKARIQGIPFLNIYHGGMGKPKAQFHYDIGGICVATEYIGPPRVIA